MKDKQVLAKLEEIVGQLGIDLRWDEGEFTGGICRLGERKILVINRSLPIFVKIEVLCRELSRTDLSTIFILPAIREQISRFH